MNGVRLFVVAMVCGLTVAAIPRRPLLAADGAVLALSPEDQQEITTRLGAGVVGQALPSNPIADPSVYFPLQDRALTYQVTSGSHTGNTQTLKVVKHNRPDGTPAWRFGISPTLAGFIRQNVVGDLLMPAVADSDEGVVVVTTPASPFVINGIKPGETRSLSQNVSVNYLDDPTRRDYSGRLNVAYTYVGTFQLTVPAGTYPAALMRIACDGKVGPAHTKDTAYYFFAPQVGVVAMISQEDVEAFWIIHIDSKMGKVLVASN
jgi:hypothetical protein